MLNFVGGTEGHDNITATNADDEIVTFAGHDFIFGLGGNDLINTGSGHDVIDGGDGDDVILAGAGFDISDGGEGSDTYGGMFDMFIGQHLAQAAPLGIGEMLVQQYAKQNAQASNETTENQHNNVSVTT